MESKDKRTGWLLELKVGDKIAVSTHWHGYFIGTVDKITPTGRITIGKTTYGYDGYEISSGYARNYLCKVTEEILASIKRVNALNKINQIKWDSVDTDNILKVLEIVGETRYIY